MLRTAVLAGIGVIIGLIIVFGLIQLIPYGHDHTNPPDRVEPTWDSIQTRALTQRACFDCHSNDTVWPWYSNVAPLSWLIQRDVDRGRNRLNFSEWDRPPREVQEISEPVRRGQMPQWYYVVLHPDANLSPAERQALIQGLDNSLSKRNALRTNSP